MNIERSNETENEVEFVEKSTNLLPQKITKTQVLIFLACLVFSFIVWCYANYLDDPIIKKDISFNLVAEGFEKGVTFVIYNDDTEVDSFEIYGEKSTLYQINNYEIKIKPSDFENENGVYVHSLELKDGVHSHTEKIEIKLIPKEK